ncbi:MAG TPA: ATP-dependent DNA helicase [Patescibacteria group bacterium]|nr:ATP-dependent DNA helicase [Patescibacteria group bacterium]
MQSYDHQYKSLNTAQREAVNNIEGPLLVIAGPGTGKTQLLAMRVANILHSTDTNPSNILCLTFTNKASVNMKERIISLAGGNSGKTVVKTFHSFAAEIMNTYPDYFWNAAALNVAPEAIQLDIIESIISDLPLDNPLALRFAGQFTLINDIQRSISLAKDAGLTPDKLKAVIDANLSYIELIEPQLIEAMPDRLSLKKLNDLSILVNELPEQKIDKTITPLISLPTVIKESLDTAITQDIETGKTTQTGKWKKTCLQTIDGSKGMFSERKRNQWWLELAKVYALYREEIHRRGFYDYADMLVEVISQLEKNPELLADVQERFLYVMIDEFQDTNPAQLRLAHLIADHHSSNGNPNLMAVGDDDQSIFKFNGAELSNMLGFKRSYKDARTIMLIQNYRSTQEILDASKRIIEQAEDRLVKRDKSLNKTLVANSDIKSSEIRALSYSSRELQLSSIAEAIKSEYSSNKDIAVLARNHDSLLKMSGLLMNLDIPIRYEQQANILEHEIVEQIYLIAKIINSVQKGDKDNVDALVHKVIRHPMWDLAPKLLWDIALNNYKNPDWMNSLFTSKEPGLNSIGSWFVYISKQADNQPLAVTLEQIIGLKKSREFESPLRNYFLLSDKVTNKYLKSISAIQLLRALVHEFAGSKEPNIDDFIRLIEINRDNRKIIADESPFVTGKDAVQLLTIHKSKGLEFNSVYIVDAVEKNWSPSKSSRRPPANLPLLPAGDNFDDYVRLMYVAATRARSHMTISSYHKDHAGKDVADSPIVQAAFDIKNIDEKEDAKLIQILEDHLHWPELDEGDEKAMLQARLETYSLSVTHLLNFLDVKNGGPQYFKEKNLLRLPELKSPHLSYGTAMHAAMEEAQRSINKDSFSLAAVSKVFSEKLRSEQLTKSEETKFSKQGKVVLERLFNNFQYSLPRDSLAEQDINSVRLDKAVIRGKIDRLDTLDNKVLVIDYKTGKPLSNLETKDQTKAEKAWRHRTQIIFYWLLLENSSRFSNMVNTKFEGQMVYLEAETKKELIASYIPSQEEKEGLKKLIEAVYRKIINLDLPDTSKYSPDFEGAQQFETDLLEGKT